MGSKAIFFLHDLSYGCSCLIVWLVGNSIFGVFSISTYFCKKLFCFFLSQRATERTSSTMHRDFWTFNFCKLCILTIAMFFAQKNEFARLIVDVESGCGNVHLLWTPSTIQCLNNLYVGTLISVMEYTALCRTIWLV